MYSACLYCHKDLGRNEVIEACPIGRRLAFDSEKGRLWVICRSCSRWNLSPLEERWEAVETCERRFRDTRRRAATEHIGLARVREGLELVRIGKSLRPELAAWRYGDQFGRRRRVAIVKAGALGVAVAASIGAVAAGSVALGTGVLFAPYAWPLVIRLLRNPFAVIAEVKTEEGRRIRILRKDLADIQIRPSPRAGGWVLDITHTYAHDVGIGDQGEDFVGRSVVQLAGPTAVRAAGTLFAHVNPFGASPRQVEGALSLLERQDEPAQQFHRVAHLTTVGSLIRNLPYEVRLALEMASHEETERRALEGELKELEAAWREAEEIAAIADDLLLPSFVTDFLRKHQPHA